jgi:hypothetical protein
MTTDLIDQLKQGAPTLGPVTGDDPEPPADRPVGHVRQQIRDRRRTQRAARQPFADQQPPSGGVQAGEIEDPGTPIFDDGPAAEVSFTVEQAQQLRVLWDEYLQKQRAEAGPKTMSYRCIATKNDGTQCGAIVEAGTLEERLKTGEVVRCPHGPHAPEAGIMFDRERFPQYHHELTPMEPIL